MELKETIPSAVRLGYFIKGMYLSLSWLITVAGTEEMAVLQIIMPLDHLQYRSGVIFACLCKTSV